MKVEVNVCFNTANFFIIYSHDSGREGADIFGQPRTDSSEADMIPNNLDNSSTLSMSENKSE